MPTRLTWSAQARDDLLDIYVLIGLEQPAAGDAVDCTGGKRPLRAECLGIAAHDHRELPFHGEPVAIRDHLGNLVRCVDVDQREGHMPEERLARQPQHDGAVLAD